MRGARRPSYTVAENLKSEDLNLDLVKPQPYICFKKSCQPSPNTHSLALTHNKKQTREGYYKR